MNSVTFKPWIGSKYATNNMFGKRVLVLGESHYGAPEDRVPEMTVNAVRRWAQEERAAFFTKTAKLLLGLDSNTWLSDEQRAEVWEHVAFYNFVQQCPGEYSRIRPTLDMWQAGRQPFLEVVRALKPDVILVLGKQLSSWLPQLPNHIRMCNVQHPSTGFDYNLWNPRFAEALGARSPRLPRT